MDSPFCLVDDHGLLTFHAYGKDLPGDDRVIKVIDYPAREGG